jgi:predicted MFS family arabinose efflux permease
VTGQGGAEASRAEGTAIAASVALRVLAPFAAGYFLSYMLRGVNAVVGPDLAGELGLGAAELGLLTGSYLAAFALFQLPLGVLLDRYGPRRVQASLFAVAAAGCALFAIGGNALTLTLARGMIGLGFAGGLMSGFKANVVWVPAPRRALANATVMSAGALGLLTATTPTEFAVGIMGWRLVFVALAAITVVVALAILAAVPERAVQPPAEPLREQVRQLGVVFRDRAFLAIAPLLATTAGAHIAIQTLWAGPWFRDVAQLDRAAVANRLFVMGVAFFVGILSSGAIADWFARRGVRELTVMIGFLLLFFLSQAVIVVDVHELRLLAWCAFGMSGHVAVLAYPWLAGRFGAGLAGRAHTAMNLLLFLAAFAIQYAIGAVIELFPRGSEGGYDPASYQVAFGIFLAVQLLCFGLYLANRRLFRKA